VQKPFEDRRESAPHWPELYSPSWEVRPSLDAEEEPTPAPGGDKVQVHRPLRDEPLSEVPPAPPAAVAAARPAAPERPAPQVEGSTEPVSAGASDRYVLLASLWESGTPPASLAGSNGLLALAVPVNSPLSSVFKKGDSYRFQQGGYTANYECLDAFGTPQEAFASYPEGMRVSRQPTTYLHWREPSEPGTLSPSNWVQAN
jgi:hypothetical protein